MRSKSRLFEEHTIPTEGNETLFAKLLMPRLPIQPQRVVFFAPLVGAGAGQQLLNVRSFSRRGAIVISYEYRGHPKSTGMFDLDCTIVDTHYALIWALEYARELGLPLHGFAMCYGAIPLLAQFKRGGYGRFMRSVSTISGLYHLNQILRVEDFAPIVSRHIGREIDAPSLLEEIAGGVLDCDGLGFKQALQKYLSKLMPDLRVELDYFEELKYERVNKRQALLQFCQSDYLDGVEVPPWMPCTAYIGHQDELLYAGGPADPESYKDYVLSVVPHASVLEFEMDHYGRGPDRDTVVQCVGDAFERFDTSPVPPRHVDNFTHQQAVLR